MGRLEKTLNIDNVKIICQNRKRMAFPTDFQAIVKLFHFTPNNVQGHFTVHRRVGSLDASLMRFVTSVNIAKLFLRVCEL